MCSLDWGIIKDILVALISAGIPSLVAWKIYSGWNNQKGTEVLALEAKGVIINLSKLQSLQCEIHDEVFNNLPAKTTSITKRRDFVDIHREFANSLTFISFAVKRIELSDAASKVLSSSSLFISDMDRIEGGALCTFGITMIDPSDALSLTKIMLDLALYKTVNKKYSK